MRINCSLAIIVKNIDIYYKILIIKIINDELHVT